MEMAGQDCMELNSITLRPDSDQPEFEPIELAAGDDEGGFRVIAEMLTVLNATGAE